jgi:sulfhydrogenase subunit alpha
MNRSKTIKVDYLARVEGEGALHIKVKNDRVTDVQLRIFEPPRFFEAFLRGRRFTEVPDITARICGICPVAYQMSSAHAVEDACGVTVDGPLRDLRRLLYCGEWIESHTLHVYMLHAPDFLGYESAVHLAKEHPQIVQRALQLKKVGNEIVTRIGGREIHPINVRVGGFYRVPTKRELSVLTEKLEWARDAALETVRLVSGFTFPRFEQDYEFVALRHPDEYPLNEGRLVSSSGLEIPVREYDAHFAEEHVPHSNALHSVLKAGEARLGREADSAGRVPAKRVAAPGGAYFVGPLARYNLNSDRLSPIAQQAAREAGLGPECRNPFQSIIVHSVEILYACDEALRIIEDDEAPDLPFRGSASTGCHRLWLHGGAARHPVPPVPDR